MQRICFRLADGSMRCIAVRPYIDRTWLHWPPEPEPEPPGPIEELDRWIWTEEPSEELWQRNLRVLATADQLARVATGEFRTRLEELVKIEAEHIEGQLPKDMELHFVEDVSRY